MNFQSRNYAADLQRDIGTLQNMLRFIHGEQLDPQVKQRVVSDLTVIVEREIARLQHALDALGERGFGPESVKQVKNLGAQARAKVRWAVDRLEKRVRSLEGAKKHDLEKFLEHVNAKRQEITSYTSRTEMKKNAAKWQALFAEIEKKEASLDAATLPVHEEKTGRKFRTD
jgi:hypothetical protein